MRLCAFTVAVCGGALYPAAAAASLLLLLLLNELHGGGWRRGRPHGSDHLDAVLWERGQIETFPGSHLHLLQLLEPPHCELESTVICSFLCEDEGLA